MSKKVVEVKTLKVGKYVILDGEASKITSIQTSSPGKHGAAKARVEAVGIFDNQKRSLVKPVDSKIDIPMIDKRAAQVLAIMGSDVQLMDMEDYDTFEVPIPDEPSITVSYDHLTRLEDMGVKEYIPDGSEKAYKVKDLLGAIYVEKKSDEEILRLLRKMKDETDDKESLTKKANEVIQLQPNFFGLGVNINKIIELIGKLFKKKSK